MRLRALVATGLLLALLAGCSSGGGDDEAVTPTTRDRPASDTTTTSTVSSTTGATAAPSSTTPAFPTDPQAYTDELVRAWGRGDRSEAQRYAAGAVVDELFRRADPGGRDWDAEGCEGAAGTTYCSYVDAAGGSVLLGIPTANGNVVDGPQEVVTVVFPDRPPQPA